MTEPDGAAPVAKTSRRTRSLVALAVIAAAIAFLLFKGLGSASEYFKTAEEAVQQQDRIGTSRFRLEGTVVEGSICAPTEGGVKFLVESNGRQVPVKHDGDPPELFRENIPVVLSGAFDKTLERPADAESPVFGSDLVMIKHSSDYIEKNKDRVADYVGKEAPVTAANIPVCASPNVTAA